MERTHRQLGSRLADRLSRNYAHRFAEVHHRAAGQISTVTLHANPEGFRTRKDRPDHHFLYAGILDRPNPILIELLARCDQHLRIHRIEHIRRRNTAQDPLSQGLDDIATFDQRAHLQSIFSPTIVAPNDHVL